ncbi:MAG: tRNA pseudouridine(55) synthase TruB [Treponema sp.]|nr:tRNA pseudouridine(55) synthase TruB [Treponema sp.]
MQTQNNEAPSGIVLLAKQSGATSFSSLSSIKKALATSKVGHTGTLDSFADGLLVVLVGKLTRLVPHITGFDKTYLALIQFGTETDTLDPTGRVVRTAAIPSREQVEALLPRFKGEIDQVPPVYSAIHVGGGKRASELAREGKTAQIPARKITIYDITLLDFQEKYALVEVSCSKGTYIRALARDIAAACDSCAHLAALRRTQVGPFALKDAAGADDLGDFTISALTTPSTGSDAQASVIPALDEETSAAENSPRAAAVFFPKIRESLRDMDAGLAEFCGFVPAGLSHVGANAYANGRPLKKSYFYYPAGKIIPSAAQLAVFYPEGTFAGIVEKNGSRLQYGFVIPRKKAFTVYSWEQIAGGRFNAKWKEQGTALTIGSFDGPHFGHEALFQTALAQENLIPGVIVFARSLSGLKNPDEHAGDVATLSQKLAFFEQKGFAFAVVVDFSKDFAAIRGEDFLSKLIASCNMKFLVEGKDFHCGYKGATDVPQILEFSRQHFFAFLAVAPILYEEKRISSSRLRKTLHDGKFSAAEDMLHHVFSLDCAGWNWTVDGDSLLARKSGIQVWPKDGEYTVFAETSGGRLKTQCIIRDGTIALAHKDEILGNTIFLLSFTCT